MKNIHHNISIFQKGDQTKQSIIFVHGFPYDHYMWDNLTDDLSNDYFCVTYDIRGLGESPAGDGQFTIEMFSDDLFSVIEKSALNKPILCGLSMGGYIALRSVERNQDKFSALILCDTKSEADGNQAKLKRAQGINIINNKSLEAFISEFVPSCFAEESIKKMGEEYYKIFQRSLGYDPIGVKGCLLAMAGRTDNTDYLNKIELPSLVMCGEQDKLSPPDQMKEMADKIRNSVFRIIHGSGHMTPLEYPNEVIKNIREFLSSNKL